MGAIKWGTTGTLTSYLTTELNALADGGGVLGAAVSNDAADELDTYIALELLIAAQGGARSADARVNIYLLSSLDDTNFSYGTGNLFDPSELLTSFPLDAATTARYAIHAMLRLPPFDFKLLLENQTGQAFAASGSTLQYSMYSRNAA